MTTSGDTRRQEDGRFERLLEFAPDGIVGVGRDGAITLVNVQTEAMFGYTRDELIGQSLEILVPERMRGRHSAERAGYFHAPRIRPMGAGLELYGRRKDGSEFPAEISLSSIAGDAGLTALAAVRDVSERVEAEREKERLETELQRVREQEAEREKKALETQLNQFRRLDSVGQLAGGIAHDFNNILGVIINSAEFVADEIPPKSEAMEDVNEIRRAAERAAALTRQLLIFSRRDVVRPTVLDLNDVVADLDKLLRRVLGEHVELETRFEPDLWRVTADAGQIEQVLINLAVNARDAMPEGGRLYLQISNVHVDEADAAMQSPAQRGRYVRLVVSDTGVGMPREVVNRAFEPFYTTKPKGAGTGLGLSTVYGIVSEAGGQVHLYSEQGVGTTVKVQLPATLEDPSAPSASHTRPPRARGQTVLVVEDDASVRRVARRILDRAGYDVVITSSGREALSIIERGDQRIDLLITDMIMPTMLGSELAARTAELRPGLRTLFMSGYTDQMGEQQGERFIEKPFTADTLLNAVAKVLGAA